VIFEGVSLGRVLHLYFHIVLRTHQTLAASRWKLWRYGLRRLLCLAARLLRGLRFVPPEDPYPFQESVQTAVFCSHRGVEESFASVMSGSLSQREAVFLTGNPDLVRSFRARGRKVCDLSVLERSLPIAALLRFFPIYRRFIRALGEPGWFFRLEMLLLVVPACMAIDFHRSALLSKPLRSILTTCDGDWHSQVIGLVARRAGLNTFSIVHGFPLVEDLVPVAAERLLVWGEAFKKPIIDAGVPTSRIVVSGNPVFEEALGRLNSHAAQGNDGLRARFALQGERPAVIYLPSLIGSTLAMTETAAKRLLDAFWSASRFDIDLVVKLHPVERLQTYSRWLDGMGASSRVRLVRDVDLLSALSCSEVAVSYDSSAGLEAMGLGLPTLILDILPEARARRGAAFVADAEECSTVEDFLSRLAPLMRDPKHREEKAELVRRTARRYFASFPGKTSGERIRSLLLDVPNG